MHWLMLCLLGVMSISPAHAQENPVIGVWTGQLLTLDLDAEQDSGLKGWLDLHERQMPNSFSAIVRPGIGWDTGKGISFWAGYGWIPTWNGATLQNENRIWQQVIGKTAIQSVGLMGRVRLEQRLLDTASMVGHRARIFARAGVTFNDTYGLSLWDEAFVHLNNTAYATTGFNQNRLFVGPYMKASQGWRTEFGYLVVVAATGDDLTVNHALAMNLIVRFTAGKSANP